MFGYIRPLKTELKVRELDSFKSCYCALCHALRDGYGVSARYILNYDFLFLAMLLWPESEEPKSKCRRCPVSPVKGRECCMPNETLYHTAACSVILSYWKLKDNLSDEGAIKAAASAFPLAALFRAYKKAERAAPEFSEAVKERLSSLAKLEKAGENSLDRVSDEFAKLLSDASPTFEEDARSREIRQILYHTGRWIYITDGVNDLKEDLKKRRYNPVAARFALTSPDIPEDVKRALRVTLEGSLGLIRSAFELMPENTWAPILRNIIYLGMPAVAEAVFGGFFDPRDGGHRDLKRR